MRLRKKIRILSVDGGGIRGIIPALLLSHIRQCLDQRGQKKPFSSLFDLIAGTSTGGIIALGLAGEIPSIQSKGIPSRITNFLTHNHPLPIMSLDELVNFYRIEGEKIFPKEGINRFRGVTQAFTEKYSSDVLDELFLKYMGDTTISDTKCPVLIPAYDAGRMKIQLFRTSKAHTKAHHNYFLRDVLRATTAAPTYFPPASVNPVGLPDQASPMIDGAIFGNNPALLAYQEAKKIYPSGKKFQIISLGTGRKSETYTFEQLNSWGFLDWMNPMKDVPILSMMGEAQNQTVAYTLEHQPDVEYIRIEKQLTECSSRIDDASVQNIQCLEAFTQTLIEEKKAQIERILNILSH